MVYGSFGTVLTGHLLERASSLPFEEYMAEYLFEPMGMTHNSFAQVLPDSLVKDAAAVYAYREKEGPSSKSIPVLAQAAHRRADDDSP